MTHLSRDKRLARYFGVNMINLFFPWLKILYISYRRREQIVLRVNLVRDLFSRTRTRKEKITEFLGILVRRCASFTSWP